MPLLNLLNQPIVRAELFMINNTKYVLFPFNFLSLFLS